MSKGGLHGDAAPPRDEAEAVRVTTATAASAGAVALLQLQGPGARAMAEALSGRPLPMLGRVALRDLGGIDEGLVVALRDDWAQLMPHGGPRVVRKLIDRLVELGAVYDTAPDPRVLYPEAASAIEADTLAAIARAASPAAIDLLAAQPALWREYAQQTGTSPPPACDAAAGRPATSPRDRTEASTLRVDPGAGTPRLAEESVVLDRLLDPPSVVVVGRPNVGKSTLTNAMLGRAVSLVADLPGTTRDWVGGLAELPPGDGDPQRAVAVRWTDTPGLRTSDDAIEQAAIGLARQVVETADVLIAMRDPAIGWPDPATLPREPDLWVMNKIDDRDPLDGDGRSPGWPLTISAAHDRHLDRLASNVIARLGLDALHPPRLWAFSPTLRAWARGENADLVSYLRSDAAAPRR